MSRPYVWDTDQSGATDGQAQLWDDALGMWIPGDVAASGPSGGIDLVGAKLAELTPDDAVIWLPANLADITVSASAGDRAVILTASAAWENDVVCEPSPWFHNGAWHMLYTAGWASGAIGYATATDPFGTWTKHPTPVIGDGHGGMAGFTSHHSVYVEGDTIYALYPDGPPGVGGDLVVATASIDDPTTFTTVGTLLAATGAIAGIVNTALFKRGDSDYVLMFEAHATSGPQWQIGYAEGTSPTGSFTINTFPLPTLQIGTGVYGGPDLSRQDDGTWTMLYHASTTSSSVPTAIYRATSPDLTTWTPDGAAFIDRVVNPPEVDQVADAWYLVTPARAVMFWSGMDNVAEEGSILASRIVTGDPQWFDGNVWQTEWPAVGEVTDAELAAAVANVPEQARDAVAAMFAAGTQTGISYAYNDGADSFSSTVTATGDASDLSSRYQPLVMVTGGVPELVYDSNNNLIMVEVPNP